MDTTLGRRSQNAMSDREVHAPNGDAGDDEPDEITDRMIARLEVLLAERRERLYQVVSPR